MNTKHALMLVVAPLLYSSGSVAAGVKVVLSGTAYNGNPAYEIMLGDTEVGKGEVAPTPGGTAVTFNVQDDVVRRAGPLRISFTNDLYKEGVGDRNLFVLGAEVGNTTVPVSGFQIFDTATSGGPTAPDPDMVRLYTGKQSAVAAAPPGGWRTSPCNAHVVLKGFDNSAASVPGMKDVLADVLAQSSSSQCAIEVTGYASQAGLAGANKTISAERAQTVLDYIVKAGGKFTSSNVIGFGGTTQFGPLSKDNRVVVVQLK